MIVSVLISLLSPTDLPTPQQGWTILDFCRNGNHIHTSVTMAFFTFMGKWPLARHLRIVQANVRSLIVMVWVWVNYFIDMFS